MKFIERLSRKAARQPQPAEPSQAPLLMALEPRIMFDASVGAVAQDAAAQTTADVAKDSTSNDASSQAPVAAAETSSQQQGTQRHEVVFVDSQVSNADQLIAGLPANAEVVVLDPNKDGLQQMADYLRGRENLDAIHLLSHGADGTVQLGNVWLASNNLAEHRAALESIGAALKADGDLMLYGCDVGEGDKGQAFLDQLASISGADVAASVDDTGAAALGGNWTLERSSGAIETRALSVDGYDGLLAANYTGGAVVSAPVLGATLNNLMKYVVADFTGDGFDDILYQANGTAGAWSFAVNNRDGTFSIQDQNSSMFAGLTLGPHSTGGSNFQAADFNGDGRIDLLVSSITDTSMKLYLNTGSGFTTTNVAGTFGGVKVLVGDFNGDGAVDVLYQQTATNAPWGMLTNDGSGNFTNMLDTDPGWTQTLPLPNFGTFFYKAADVDGDGYTDLIIVAANQQMRYLRNDNGIFVDMTLSANLPTPTVTRAIVADFDGDGDADILYQVGADGTEIRYIRNDNGTFVDLPRSQSPFANISSFPDFTSQRYRVGDLDGDGDIDLIGTSSSVGGTVIYYQDGSLPKLVSSTPADNSLTVTPSANITLTFDQAVVKGTGNIYIVRTSDNMIIQTIAVGSGAVTGSGTTYTIDPPADMVAGVAYAIRIDNKTFVNANGQVYAGIRDNTTLNFTVATVAAPVIGNVNGDTVTFVEDSAYVLLDVSSNATVSDADSVNFSGGKLTVQITAGGTSGEDVLFIRDQGAGANQVTISGASILYNGLVIGTFTGGSNGNPLVVTFTSNANPTTVAALLHNLAYRNSNTFEPSTTSRSVSISMDDGAGGNSTASVVTVAVQAVNDAPVMTGVSPTLTGITDTSVSNGGNTVLSLLGGVTDVDTSALKGMAITGLTATYGKWQYSVDAGSTWSDVGVVSNSAALILTGQNLVRFVPDGIHGETATLTYKAWDQSSNAGLQGTKVNVTASGGTSAYSTGTDTASVVVTAVNDVPVVTVSGTPVSWTEGNNVASTPVAVAPTLTVSDADGPNPFSATARMLTYYSSQDTLSFVNDGLTMGNIVGTWNAGTGTLTLTSAGNQATVAQFEAALRAITYNNSSNSPNSTTRTVQFIVTDGSNAASTAVTGDITITAVNDSPTISAVAALPVNEDTPTALSQITFSDVDSTLGVVTFSVGNGTLSAIGAGGVTVGGTSTALTLSGTLANINNFIASNRLVYTPAANASGDVTLTINVNTSSVSDATTTLTLQVAAVNDAPVVTAPASIAVTEDVSSVISGISFTDVDAGVNTVTATFSVPSGTLNATSGMGVVVVGAGTDVLTLSGSLADINFFIAANGLTFKTAQDATSSVTLTVTLNDNGFSGSAGEKTDTKTVTLNVSAVNDAPVNNVPGAQTAQQNIALSFNAANGNAISITDVDAGNGLITVTLTATNGTLSLGSLSGITLLLGTGINNTSMIFEGTRANLNAALQTLSFRPGSNFIGSASLTIETNDNGNAGSGGAKTDVDTISINVVPVNPKVTSVSAQGLDRTVKVGDEVLVNVVFDQVVNVDANGGTPSLLLETGLIDRNAVYQSGSGSNTLVFKYTVQAGDISADLDFQSTAALQLNGAVLANASNDLAILTLPTVGGSDSLGGRSNIVVDGVVPLVANVQAPSAGTYITGQNLDFTVNFSEQVVLDTTGGVPRIAVSLDTGGTVYAEYVSGSGGSALVFRLTVASGQLDSNGVTLGSLIELNGGTITDLAGNATVATLNGVASTAGVNIDGIAPTVVSVAPPLDGSYKAGDVLSFTVNGSEALQTGALPPRLVLDVGGVTRYATYVSGSGSSALVFQYVVQAGDNDSNGIAVNGIDLRGEPLTDLAGNDLNLALNGMGSTAGVLVDTTAPGASSIVRVDASPSSSASVRFTVTFSEDVSGVDASDFNLVFGGSAAGSISSVIALDGHTYTVVVGNLSGEGSLRLDLASSGTGILDAAGNAITGGLTGASYSIDRVAPSVVSVDVPANGTYVAGQTLDFTVHLDEAVQLDTVAGTPRLEVTLDNGVKAYASYLSGAGSNALVFRLTVANGQLDSNGISLGGSIELNGATLRDSVGNDARTVLNGVGDTSQVRVDAVVPTVLSVQTPADGNYKAGDVLSFTVNGSEALQTGALPPRLVLDVGGVTRYATYVSGSGSSALVFQYVVQAGDNDSNGIAVNGIDLRGEPLTDLAGNDLNLALNGMGSTAGVLVDTTAPGASSIVRVDASPSSSASVRFTVTFSEDVSGVDASDFNLVFGGTAAGSISSVTALDAHTYTVVVGGLSGEGSLRLDLASSGTGILDAVGNAITGGLTGTSYSIDRVAPSVVSVDVPANGTYVAGQTLDFTVHLDEAVQVDSGNGNPRLAITLDNGQVVYADYVATSGGTALLFRLDVTSGMAGNSSFAVGSTLDLNGGSLRDAHGNDANTVLNNLGDTRGILVDAKAPQPSSIVVDGPVSPNDRSLSFTLTFDEAVSGVDASNFSVLGSNSASGVVQSVQQIDGKTYRIVVGDLRGQGSLSLSLNAPNSGIQDSAGNALAMSLVGQAQTIQSQDVGDLEYRLNPPQTLGVPQAPLQPPQPPAFIADAGVSPLLPPPLFEVRTVGGDLQPLGTIFLGAGSSAPSFIAQVFGRSDSTPGGLGGFLGFGGGDGGVFGSSTLASVFSHEVPGVSEMNVFNGSQWKQSDLNQGLRGVFGAPTFGQQLQQINETDQRQVRELAKALAQPTEIGQRA